MTVKILKEDVKRFLSVIEDMYNLNGEKDIIEIVRYNVGFALKYKDVFKGIKVEGLNDIGFNINLYQFYELFNAFYGEKYIEFKLEKEKDGTLKLKYNKKISITVEENVFKHSLVYHDIFFMIDWLKLTTLLKTCDTIKFTREGFGEKEVYYIKFRPEDREKIIKFISAETEDNRIKIKVHDHYQYLFIRTDGVGYKVTAEAVEFAEEEML